MLPWVSCGGVGLPHDTGDITGEESDNITGEESDMVEVSR